MGRGGGCGSPLRLSSFAASAPRTVRAECGNPFEGPRLVLGGQGRVAGLIVAEAPRVAPLGVDLLEGGLDVERHVGVVARQGDRQAGEPLRQPSRVELETMALRPAADAANRVERLERLDAPF